ncbi:uncharacterized protein LOC132389262 [Hypanus sabinus]|uniref:uncharacterized protein LOC132389262 n=1 Tax=Hypanus sabinus TaxID=79690 RepID=UPI0028C45CCE|nr:uncharacterized protein LOC132389262 [Hypanus sabinus]
MHSYDNEWRFDNVAGEAIGLGSRGNTAEAPTNKTLSREYVRPPVPLDKSIGKSTTEKSEDVSGENVKKVAIKNTDFEEYVRPPEPPDKSIGKVTTKKSKDGSGEIKKLVAIKITRSGEYVRPPIPPDKLIGKVTTKKSKDDSGENVKKVAIKNTDFEEYVRPPVPPDKLIGKVTTEKSKDGSGEIKKLVAIKITRSGEYVRPPIPPDKLIGKVTTKKSKDDSGENVKKVAIKNTDFEEYVRPPVPPDKLIGKVTTEKSKDGSGENVKKVAIKNTDFEEYVRPPVPPDKSIGKVTTEKSVDGSGEIMKKVAIKITRSAEYVRPPVPPDKLIDKVTTNKSKDGSGENVKKVAIKNTGFEEYVRPPVPPDKSIGKVTTEKSVDEDGPYEVTRQLARSTDLQLSRVTESCYEQLKSAIEDDVEHISESLISKWRMSEINLEKIRTLIRNNQRRNASQYTLESILGGDTVNCRMFWNVLSETQINPQYLMKLLTQDIERDVKHRHRCNLRSQSRKLNLLKPRLISDMYTEPTITVIQHEHANVTRESNEPTGKVENPELFRPSNRDSDRSTISVVCGPAGTGKTTLIQKLIYDWATGMKHEEFSFVLHFKIQNLKAMKGLITLNRLTLDVYPYMENYLDHLWNEPKKLLFIFDDLDQLYLPLTLPDAGRNSNPRYRCTDTESEHLVCDIVRCLLQGEFLRGCSVLITTRVWNLELLDHVTADSNFQVLGFTTKKAKEYFCRYLCNRQNANQIVELIEQNEILWNMCRNPLFCVTLASSLVSCQAQGGQITIPIVSHTKVLSDYVTHLLAKCGYSSDINRKCLIVVGELAEKGIRQNTLSFEGDSLRVLDSCPPMFISAFMYQDPDKQSGGIIYEFRHSVLRDFLAALTNVLNAPTSRLKRIIDERSTDVTGRFSTFSIFLVGLSSRKSTDRLEKELQTFPTEVTSCISEWLTQSVSRRLTDMDTKHTQKMFLSILYSLLEFGDNDIVTEVLNTITSIKLNQLRLKSPDYIVLSRTLNSLEVIQELDLSSCFAQPEEIWKLEQLLPRCVILRLNQNNLQDSGMKRLFDVLNRSKVKTLTLQSNHLTDNCLESVFSALTKNPSLMQLNLSNSSQDEKQANQFTVEKLKYHYERSTQQKEIKWLRIKNIGQDITRSSRESNCLTLTTD